MTSLYYDFDAVTSLVDFYGFHGKGTKTVEELEQDLNDRVRESLSQLWDQRKLIPYVQKHEFEGLLFSSPNAFRLVVGSASNQAIAQLIDIRSSFQTPEEINDNPNTAPSKRISVVMPGYHKRLHGPLVADATGLAVIRKECPRFDNWVARLESLTVTLR